MTTPNGNPATWIMPLLLGLGALGLGFAVERLLVARFRKAVLRRFPWKWLEILLSSFRGMAFLWISLAGAHWVLLSLVLRPEVYASFQKVLVVAFIFSITLVTARFASSLVDFHVKRSETLLPATSLFATLTQLAVFILGLLILFQTLGIAITPVLTAFGVGGLAVALALQDTLANLFAGLHVLASRQIRAGDFVSLEGGEDGYVDDITWRNTTIRTLEETMVVVPNARLSSSLVHNYSLPGGDLRFNVEVGVSYASDLEHVELVAIEVARDVQQTVEGADRTFEPWLRYTGFGDSSINFRIYLQAKDYFPQYIIRHEFIKRLHRAFGRENIQIPFPIRTVVFPQKHN
ncbi:MAG: mechanosensitive ion channel family protein [Synergistota bacterium]|nr:mechanosensitive ion channel family protein [Synergistota bacterium]